jgi:ACS family hexuronate transporter-like MFS transporter
MAQFQKSGEAAPAGITQPIGNFRWVICGLLFFATAINYIDRQILAILKPQLSHDLHWDQQDYASIVAAFQFTYALGYLFGGRLMERFGVKRGLPAAVLVWSLFAAMHGLMRSVAGFIFVRRGLGISEGGFFPQRSRPSANGSP